MILKYFPIFLAILFLGSAADVPVMFLGVQGVLSLYFVFIAGFLTDMFSDLFWYSLGKKVGIQRFEKKGFFKVKPEMVKMVGLALDKYGILMLFSSKFIYSFGTPTQLIAGAHRYPIKKFLLANSLGGMTILFVLFIMANVLPSVELVESYLKNTFLNLLIFVIITAGIYFLINKSLKRFFNSESSEKEPLP